MTPPPNWQKSTYSGEGNNCVELRRAGGGVELRESAHPATVLTTDPARLRSLLAAVRRRDL